MRRALLFLIAGTLSLDCFAQRIVDLEFVMTRMWTSQGPVKIQPYQKIFHDGKTIYSPEWLITNHGPDTLQLNDTFFFTIYPGVTYPLAGFKVGVGDTVTIPSNGITYNIPPGISLPFRDTIVYCDSFRISAGSGNTPVIDPDATNNRFCENIIADYFFWLGVYTVTDEKDGFLLSPNPANDRVTLRFDLNNAADVRILLRNALGQTVHDDAIGNYSGKLTRVIDVSNLPRGLYMAELHYDREAVVSKLMIQ